ncbi:MAG TPA: hypothetical protein PKI11_13455 [Candidatus Hydrogenedentes bacterium]|nr:hypothetical protein [Candidatus Hydrogenedentota bacterium]
MSQSHGTWYGRFLGGFLLVIFLAGLMTVAVRASWLCDDAYITFRTVDNVVKGHGPRWNVEERVQAYTHPLWMLLLSAVYVFTREVFVTAQMVGLILTLAVALLLALVVARTPAAALAALAALGLSKAFIEYSTSGLENPLTHLLLVSFLALFFSDRPDARKVLPLSLLAGLAALTRMDTLLIYLPALIFLIVKARSARACVYMACGFLPFAAWEAFSVIYYGFPFPNTAYAKLSTGVPAADLARQGLAYFISQADIDPLTLAVALCGLALPFALREWRAIMPALGAVLYLVYVVRIGGDFMVGRYFTAPMLVAAVLLARAPMRFGHAFTSIMVLGLLCFMGRYPIVLTDAEYGLDRLSQPGNAFRDERGVSDQRGFYYHATGLLRGPQNGWEAKHEWVETGRMLRAKGKNVSAYGATGFKGYYAGPDAYIVDYHALSDPLLARLPGNDLVRWHIGHFKRDIPAGYLAVLRGEKEALDDPDLQAFLGKLFIITRGPVWSRERLRAIWEMNRGRYDGLIAMYAAQRAANAEPARRDILLPPWTGRPAASEVRAEEDSETGEGDNDEPEPETGTESEPDHG